MFKILIKYSSNIAINLQIAIKTAISTPRAFVFLIEITCTKARPGAHKCDGIWWNAMIGTIEIKFGNINMKETHFTPGLHPKTHTGSVDKTC